MSKKFTRSDALENISTWSTNDVLSLLRKNGLEECCTAVSKRQIDGDELLHLTEGKLTLWKSDLTSYLIRELLTFVEKIKKFPEKFVQEKNVEMEQNEDHMSDTSSWDTDFEDEIPEDNTAFTDTRNINVNQINSNYENDRTISKKMKNVNANAQIDDNTKRQDEETTYVNFESTLDAGKVYVNYQDNLTNLPQKNLSRLHGTIEKTLAEQLKEQLQLRNSKKPMLKSKPEILISKRIPQVATVCKQPQKSFLHDESKTKTRPPNDVQKRMAVPPPPAPKKNADQSSQRIGKNDKDASKPSISIRNLDLIANLPTRQDKSEDEYEKFDKQIIEQNQKSIISKIDSKQSLNSGSQSSVESVYQPSSTTSCEDEEEPYEIYESITETPEDDDNYLSPIKKSSNSGDPLPPPLPVKLPTTLPLTFHRTKSNNANERSPEKKSATLPHSGSSTSLLTERATRPLPPPPDRLSYVEKPWFHNVTREQAIILITEQGTYGNSQDDGYFLLRPSTTNVNSPLALVLWCRDRVYNIPVRKRSDNRYALGSVKVNETSFSSVEEIVTCYMKEELVLYTGGVQTGSTKLTGTPLK
ncbi:uncharacterized protein LOC124430135 isoform X1 [Vespa crabro]|uniref:uncharacterized protein LOC124430135 isoform X1 n=2 Tax=Vespa crabro TaxID=7445 RepID=UPI001F006CB3|nr:uncharacterized protein LOC124430135 isoform X1 [Vespa crabro]